VDLYFRQSWIDRRLAYNITDLGPTAKKGYFKLDQSSRDKIWIPDVFFPNEKKALFHYVTVPNFMIKIFPNGEIIYSSRWCCYWFSCRHICWCWFLVVKLIFLSSYLLMLIFLSSCLLLPIFLSSYLLLLISCRQIDFLVVIFVDVDFLVIFFVINFPFFGCYYWFPCYNIRFYCCCFLLLLLFLTHFSSS